MAAVTEDKKSKKIRQFYSNIDAQILMTTNQDDLMILGSLFMYAGKNIFVTKFGKKKARRILIDYIDHVCKQED